MARAKEFDEDAVLLKAMRLFWEQGYEKTSINDLVESMGVHRRSLYDTFGDKRQLFLKAIERYGSMIGGRFQAGVAGADSSRKALRTLFDLMIDGDTDRPPGCLLVNMATELALRDAEVDARIGERFGETEQLLTVLIREGQRSGEFSSARRAEELAEHLHSVMLGIRVLARTSAAREKLHRIADAALDTLDV